nr:hypothetical protein [Pseudomonas fluorescens]
MDTTSDGNPVKDAMQIYAVADVPDREKPCT